MTFQLNRLYDNVHFRDVLVYVLQTIQQEDGSIVVCGVWWNKGQSGEPWSMGVPCQFTVDPRQFNHWFLGPKSSNYDY